MGVRSMPTSQTSQLSKPSDGQRIAPWELAYFQARNRSRAHELVLSEFDRSGITQAELARRLGKRPEIISRLLGGVGNWGLDTLSDLLFGISGGEVAYEVAHPLDDAHRNYQTPHWLTVTQPSAGAPASHGSATASSFTLPASGWVAKADGISVSLTR
jgi:hypothetical protein